MMHVTSTVTINTKCDFRKSAEDNLDGKQSSLREQLVTTKEALNRAVLDKEIMEAEKAEVVEALCKVKKNTGKVGRTFKYTTLVFNRP